MPSGKTVIVERVINGQLHARFEEQMAPGTEVVVIDGDDHVHVSCGTHEELEAQGLLGPPAPEPKPKAARKPAAKKPAAKKPASKKATK